MIVADEHMPAVTVRFSGELGEPLILIQAAALSAEDAIAYAQTIFATAARACAGTRLDVAGTA
jgi:hypothetical protein